MEDLGAKTTFQPTLLSLSMARAAKLPRLLQNAIKSQWRVPGVSVQAEHVVVPWLGRRVRVAPTRSHGSFHTNLRYSSTITDAHNHLEEGDAHFHLDEAILRHALSRNPNPTWDAVSQVHSRSRLRRLYPTYYDFIDDPQSTAPRVLQWADVLECIVETSNLLDSTYPWTSVEWQLAQELLSHWSTHETIRGVVLQFSLYHRCLMERSRLHPESEAWLEAPLVLEKVLNNWRMVYSASDTHSAQSLSGAGLSPSDILLAVVREFHGRYQISIREKLLHLILEASSTSGKAPEFANIVIQTSMELWQGGIEACFPKIQLWNLAMCNWVEADRGRRTVRGVLGLLEEMNQLSIPLDKISYHMAIRAWGSLKSTEGAEKAENLLFQMCSEHVHDHSKPNPDVFAFTMVSKAWADSQSPNSGPRAVALYNKMQDLREQGKVYGERSFDVELINSVIECFKYSYDVNSAEEAEQFWRQTGCASDHVTYVGLISLYCKAGKMEDIQRLFDEMEQQNTVMNVQSYVALFTALAKSNLDNRVEVADTLLQSIKATKNTSTLVYNAYLSILVTSSEKLRLKAFKVLEEMKNDQNAQPNKITYSVIMNGFSRSKNVERAASLLRTMYDEFMNKGNQSVAPDVQAFNTVLAGYARQCTPEAAAQAEAFLHDMRKLHNEGLLDIKPDVYTISSDKKMRGKAAGRSEEMLHKAKDWGIQLNQYCYNNVMDAWARARYPDRAAAIFLEMSEAYKHGNDLAKPDASSFNILIKAWAFSKKSEAPARAEQLLQQMLDLAESGDAKISPNVRTYTTLVLCHGLSGQPGAPQRAEAIVQQMDTLYKQRKLAEGPNRITFVTLKQAWQRSKEKQRRSAVIAIDREIRRRFG